MSLSPSLMCPCPFNPPQNHFSRIFKPFPSQLLLQAGRGDWEIPWGVGNVPSWGHPSALELGQPPQRHPKAAAGWIWGISFSLFFPFPSQGVFGKGFPIPFYPTLDSPRERDPTGTKHPKILGDPAGVAALDQKGMEILDPHIPTPWDPISFEVLLHPRLFLWGTELGRARGMPGRDLWPRAPCQPLSRPDPAPSPQPAPGHEAPPSDAGTRALRGKRRQGWGQSPVGLSPGACRGQRGPGSRNPAGNEALKLQVLGERCLEFVGCPLDWGDNPEQIPWVGG